MSAEYPLAFRPIRASVRLWSINRWTRWLGFRVFIELDDGRGDARMPTRIGITWTGLYGSRRWASWER